MNESILNDSNFSAFYIQNSDTTYTGLAFILNKFIESSYSPIVITIIWTSLVIFGLIGNGLVVFIAIAYKKLNDATNCYIFNLAITDMLFILFCIPFTNYVYTNGDWPFGVTFCKLNHFISHVI